MAIHVPKTEALAGTAYQPELLDAQILQRTIRKSIYTSSEAFLKTVEEVDNCGTGYWEQEIASSTWAVIQRGEDVIGVAVARRPDPEKNPDVDPPSTRFIESVWIDPELRGSHLGERLVRFLFAVEYAKSPGIREFLLWVFEKNVSAIRLYQRMGFVYDIEQKLPDGSGRIELRYRYSLKPDAAPVAAAAESRQQGPDIHGLIYRVLGDRETSNSSPRWFSDSSTESRCGSLVR
jgi:ribosomal protein S18 acetylase RimI-like enzyme